MTLGRKARPRSCKDLRVKLRSQEFILQGLRVLNTAMSHVYSHFRKITRAAVWNRMERRKARFEAEDLVRRQ